MKNMARAMNYLRGWIGRAGWRVFAAGQVQSLIVMVAFMMAGYAASAGWHLGYLIAAALIVVEVPLGITFMTDWRFDLDHYMRVVDR
jgi:hypothetical protein